MRPDAHTLMIRINDQLTNENLIGVVLNTTVAARNLVIQDNFVAGRRPHSLKVPILHSLIPKAILTLDHIAICAMVNRAHEFTVGLVCLTFGDHHK